MRKLPFLLLPLLSLAVASADAEDEAKPLSRVAFGSCAHQERDQPIWGPIVGEKPELFLFLGDVIYADTEDMKVMKQKYDKLGQGSTFLPDKWTIGSAPQLYRPGCAISPVPSTGCPAGKSGADTTRG